MGNLEKIFQLVRERQKPCFVVSEKGDAVLVVMPLEEYEKLQPDAKYEQLAERVNELTRQTEELNREIIQAQMEEFEEQEEDAEQRKEDGKGEGLEAVYIEPIESN